MKSPANEAENKKYYRQRAGFRILVAYLSCSCNQEMSRSLSQGVGAFEQEG